MEIYRQLGDRIDRAFEREGRARDRFPRIAADALREARIPERSTADDVLAWVFAATSLPPQNDLDEAFGEPPITVYSGRDFHVEVLFWVRTVTTVHGHGFSGAFQPLAGERLQTRHAFEPHAAAPPRDAAAPALPATLGALRFVGAEVLGPADVVEIHSGLVHAIVHLAEPSATIVVRTPTDPEAPPQLDYRAPWLAHDPFRPDEARLRKLQSLRLLCELGRPDALARAAEVARASDLAACFDALDLAYRAFGTEARIAPVLDAARERHGDRAAACLVDVLREARRLRAVQALLRRVRDPDQRFFLALLHHVPARDDIARLLAARFPGEPPLERAESLAAALSASVPTGCDVADPLTRALVRAMLRADSPAAIRAELARTYGAAQVHARAAALDRHADSLRRTVLAPLFRPSAAPSASRRTPPARTARTATPRAPAAHTR